MINYHDKIERYYLNAGDIKHLENNEDIDILTKDGRHIKLIYEEED